MSVVDVCPLRDGITAEWAINRRTYRVPLLVTTDTELDGPYNVMLGVQRQILVSTYSYGLDNDPFAVLVSLSTPRRAGNNRLKNKWIVEAVYEYDAENNPLFTGIQIEPYYLTEPQPIVKAEYGGAFVLNNGQFVQKNFGPGEETYNPGSSYPIGNSARVPILPSPERDGSQPAYRVRWSRLSAWDATAFINTVNRNTFLLEGIRYIYPQPGAVASRKPFSKLFNAETVRLRDVQQSIRKFNGEDVYDVTLEFVEDSAFVYELDRGVTARAQPGDPDGKGGTYSGGDFPEGSPQTREILDANGQPISEPVLLNGAGKPLNAISPNQEIYLKWRKYPKSDFSQIPIGN
jgi:hypothetical protein